MTSKKRRRPQQSRRSQQTRSQQARRSQQTRSQQARRPAAATRRVRGWVWVVFGLTVAAVAAILLFTRADSSRKLVTPPGVKTFPVGSRNHVSGTVNYPQTPAVGGDHSSVFQNCGVYTSPIQPEMAVHSMEHGAVWITYRPDLDPNVVQQVQSVARAHGYVLLSPWKDSASMPSPIVLSAWGVQQQLAAYDKAAVDLFVATYAQGPQTPEPGAACTGGNGSPR